MKNVFRIVGCVSVFMMTVLSSCTKEDNVTPDDNGSSLAGTWNVSENSKEYGPSTYTATIDVANSTDLTINGLYSLSKGTVAIINGSNLTIQSQIIDGVSISGTGVKENANRVTLKYFVKLTAKKTDTVSSTFTR